MPDHPPIDYAQLHICCDQQVAGMGTRIEKTVFEYLLNCSVESLFCETLSIEFVTRIDIFL